MMIKRFLITICLITVYISNAHSQVIERPNFDLKNPETIEVRNIVVDTEMTIISLSVENRIIGGTFCADKNIYIIYPDGSRSKLITSKGIPVCPDTYKFKTIGERLDFTLSFPGIKEGTGWIDLVEECSDNCFSIYGIVLDNELNKKIDEVVSMAEKGETTKSVEGFSNILSEGKNIGIEGSIYNDIITLLVKAGKTAQAKEWYDKMLLSKSPRVDLHIKNLNSRGIIFH
jgi:pentatricopeptide repeat protein